MDERQALAAMRVSGREALLRQCLTNVQAILEETGSSLAKAVSFTVVLADGDDFAGMNEEWLRWFPCERMARSLAGQDSRSDIKLAPELLKLAQHLLEQF